MMRPRGAEQLVKVVIRKHWTHRQHHIVGLRRITDHRADQPAPRIATVIDPSTN